MKSATDGKQHSRGANLLRRGYVVAFALEYFYAFYFTTTFLVNYLVQCTLEKSHD